MNLNRYICTLFVYSLLDPIGFLKVLHPIFLLHIDPNRHIIHIYIQIMLYQIQKIPLDPPFFPSTSHPASRLAAARPSQLLSVISFTALVLLFKAPGKSRICLPVLK